jgi:hypothetical protein
MTDRVRALGALTRLPDALAEPRLKLAAADPARAVRDSARSQWMQRFARACPVAVADLPAATLLVGPVSEPFEARLAVIHGRVREARAAMARALVAGPAEPEALVLLLQLVGDDSESSEPLATGLDEGWAAKIVTRFGQSGVDGLCALAARYPEPEHFGWMRRLGGLIERGVILRQHAGSVRELAARHVASEDSGCVGDALRVLELLGAPVEIFERILTVALDDDEGSLEASRLLLGWPDRTVDARLTSEMALALADRNWSKLACAARIALGRGAPAARVIAERVLDVAEGEPGAVDAAVECARHLREVKALDEAWALGALSRPGKAIFEVAARAWRSAGPVRDALEAALGSRERGGASAVQAAIALLQSERALSPRDRRLVAILGWCEPAERAKLVSAMLARGAPFATLSTHLNELLVSTDPAVTCELVGVSSWLSSPRARAFLRAIAPQVVDEDLRADIEDAVPVPTPSYWTVR